MRDIRINVNLPNLQSFEWRRDVCVPLSGTNMAADTSVTQFCYEGVNSSLEELMNIKVSFLIQFLTLDSKILKKK